MTALNGDNFAHGYSTVDFGGLRGWGNQFEDSGGPGASHTFGRAQWSVIAGKRANSELEASLPLHGTIAVPAVNADGTPRKHVIEHILNFEPSDRLRLYQYDPLHHDVTIFSLH